MAQEQQNTDSISDFLYADLERLKGWLAQLDDNGVLLDHTASSGSTQSATDDTTASISGEAGKNILIAKAEIGGLVSAKMTATRQALSSIQQRFDASWSIPLNVLDRLDEGNFIRRKLADAPVGSLVLVAGTPHIVDLTLVKAIWGPGSAYAIAEIPVTNQESKKVIRQVKEGFQRVGDILNAMPPSTQINMQTLDGLQVWAPMKEPYLTIDPVNLALQHGTSLPGMWHLLGVVDAIPDGEVETESAPANGMVYTELMQAAATVLSSVRGLMGRPTSAFGLTPLLLFRSVDPAS